MVWNSYNIENELIIRKKLESMLNYDIELQKNDDKYFWDICCYRYNSDTNKKTLLGYIELEVSDTWVDKYPKYWKYYSFLNRKIFKYDRTNQEFTEELKDDWGRTIYLIVNQSFTDMICQTIKKISDFKFQYKNVTGKYYNDCFRRVKKDSTRVIRGEQNCADFIKNYFEKQRKIEEYDV